MLKVLFCVIAVTAGLATCQPLTNPLEIFTNTVGKAIGAGAKGAGVVVGAAAKAVEAGVQGAAGVAGGAAGVVGAGVAGAAELAGETGRMVSEAIGANGAQQPDRHPAERSTGNGGFLSFLIPG